MPRLLPILLVHGFDGAPSSWTESGFRQYLIANGDLDPNLVRCFDYGLAEDGTYNNRGDLRQIASRLGDANLPPEDRLLCSVDQLSDNSVARGGPAQVTLIAHSLGGIICRYYLSRRTADEWGTLYRGNVGRLITLGTPHRGVELARLVDLAPRNSPQWWFIRLLERLGLAPARPAGVVEQLAESLQRQQREQRGFAGGMSDAEPRVLLTDSPIYAQLHPDSPLLAELARPGMMPAAVRCDALYGDICYTVRISMNRLTLVNHTVSFGDLVVSAASARDIPNATATSHPFVEGASISMTLTTVPAAAEPRALESHLPAVSHNCQVANRAFQEAVLRILVA